MAFYYGSWFILFAPLFSFAVIVFGTRIWDVLVRPNDAAQVDPMPGEKQSHAEDTGHADAGHEYALVGAHAAHATAEEGAGGSPYGRVYSDISYTEVREPRGETLTY